MKPESVTTKRARLYELAAIVRIAIADKSPEEQEMYALEITYSLEDAMDPQVFQSMRFYNALRCKGCTRPAHLHEMKLTP